MTTISDVARLARVSVSTVSHVINGTKTVSNGTRERVEAAIAESAYIPNPIARTLRSGRSRSIGFVVTDTSQHVFGAMITEVERSARQAGQTLLLANSGEDVEQEAAVVSALLHNRIDALIIAPVSDESRRIMDRCRQAGVPVILIDRLIEPRFDQVGIHNRQVTRSLTRHLIELGHTDIALVAAAKPVWTVRERIGGFRDAMEEGGLEFRPDSVIEADVGLADGQAQTEARMSTRPPTALVAASTLLTVGTLRAFANLGMRYPDDVAFVSFDGISNSEFVAPSLTHFVHPVRQEATEAMALLQRRMQHPESAPTTILVDGAISHGVSCGCTADHSAGFDGMQWTAPVDQRH